MREGIVISGFDRTGNMVKPWADAGYLCYCVDIQHEPGERREGNIIYVGADMLTWWPPFAKIAAAFFFPPCTDVACSGARWMKDKGLGAIIQSLQFFKRSVDIGEWSKAPYMIENPRCTVSTYWREPDARIHPWMYGDMWTKETWLWTGNGFRVPLPLYFREPEGTDRKKIHHASPGPDRANFRSETPPCFSVETFKANHMEGL